MIRELKILVALLGVVAVGAIADISNREVLSTAVAQQCACGDATCGGCLAGRFKWRKKTQPLQDTHIDHHAHAAPVYEAAVPCQSCAAPEPECLYCELQTKKIQEERTGFVVEQKEVCVPAVRLPWMKNCPPKKSRVRTVNVLKKKTYKTDRYAYQWDVHEPEDFNDETTSDRTPTLAGDNPAIKSQYPDPAVDSPPTPKLSDPADALKAVPRPPIEN